MTAPLGLGHGGAPPSDNERLSGVRDEEPTSPLFDVMPQLGWAADAKGWIYYYNRRWYEYTGATPEQMEGWGWQSVHDPALLPRVMDKWNACLATGRPFELAFTLRRFDGVFRWFLTRATPMRDPAGNIVRWIGINTDIDDQKRAEEAVAALASANALALKETQQARQVRTDLFANAPAPIALLRGSDLVIEFANPAVLEVWGRTPDIVGRPLLEALPELRGQIFEELLAEVMRTGKPHGGNESAARVHRDGRLDTVYFNFVYTATRDATGAVDGVAIFAFDVTQQVVARQRATLGASVGRALVARAPLADQLRSCCEALVELGASFARIWTYDASHEVLDLRASAGLYTHLDGPHGKVPLGTAKIGRIALSRTPHLTNAVIGDPEVGDQDWAKREGMVAFAGYPLVVGERLVGVMALFAKGPLSGETLAALASVSDQIALGIERDNGERFRELFIGMLAHDLRNPLNAVTMAAYTLGTSPTLAQPLARTVERVKNAADRMARMITQVLDFTRARSGGGIPVTRTPADLQAVCAQVIDELTSSNPERMIEAQYLGDANGAWDADRLAQVFSNLVGNALTYGSPAAPIRVVVDATGEDVHCSVHNMGGSMPPEVLPMLFDPFRRASAAKTAGTQGLGLGLFIAHQIVVAHGGTITVRSSDAEGTQFDITLPRAYRRSTLP